ncbi:GntR family transcriptional regulator [Psychromonas marina]|uniref:GntR family transcriptional regulator n=1 Tax=Psychromonas marina TaxID=88364 RepID=A0ABQ6E1A6_9GAMM|nr:PLP-dependent aminotransferase family protein [Psychromonas marina]GLS91112.1 GntR family transcriptional regulator [Psychromonas marina]
MKTLNIKAVSDEQKQAKYLAISQAIREAIKCGQVISSEQLPSARQLAEQLKTNRHTIMAAYNELIAQGWITSKQRKGYFVAADLPVNSSLRNKPMETLPAQPFRWKFTKNTDPSTIQTTASYRYNFAGGTPDISLFPFHEFKSYVGDAFSRPNINELNYGNTAGYTPLITQVTQYLRRARSITNREIVITNGSQEALYILSQILLSPILSVATEAMGYAPAWRCFTSSGASIISIKQDQQGMIPEALEQAIERQIQIGQPIALVYLTPLHQYPTTVTLPVSRRHAIYRIASKHNIAIIEDDYDHEYHYRCQPLAPIASDDPSGLVIYLSTFSKVMFPGVRIGFMALDKTLSDAVVNYKTIINHKVSVPMQDAIARWMQAGAFERYLRKATKIYHQRRDFMVQQLTHYQQLGRVKSFTIPDGGMAMWVELNESAELLAKTALSDAIFIQQEGQFLVDKTQSKDRFIRLGFAGLSTQDIASGLKCIFKAR